LSIFASNPNCKICYCHRFSLANVKFFRPEWAKNVSKSLGGGAGERKIFIFHLELLLLAFIIQPVHGKL